MDIHKNSLQVINQYTNKAGQYENRYDVTILVNGFPLVQIELKRRGQDLQEAFNQINRYKAQSFLLIQAFLNTCKSLLFQMVP